MAKTLFLIGFMASGKSSLGSKIARQFNMDFLDLDVAISEREGLTINELFVKQGEEGFRKIESEVLKELDIANKVVATGGGTPIFGDNMLYMKNNGAVAYLVVPTSVIIGRLRQNREERPLVKDLSDAELTEFVEKTLEQRKIIYSQADILIPHTKSWSLLKMELQFLLG